jgi:glycosyltransferase involved in cell wall biosynthesis
MAGNKFDGLVMQTLTIVIPALNEEQAIGRTISRCLDARPMICKSANLDEVEVVVVSDGSTDRTAEIAQSYEDVQVIVFPQNRGYGAAIKEGFSRGKGTLVGFLDADGTCDPNLFGPLCRILQENNADVALGSRLGPESKMPRVRRIGNRLYALLLGLLCGQSVTDTASGMRVLRRSALPDIYPLPDGLHFTPAMSARALLSGMKVIETPMPYEERIGVSKLSVLRDGIRFLRTIIDGVLCFRPERLFLLAFAICCLTAAFLAAYPTEFYLHERRLEEWMIYRFIGCFLLGVVGFVLFSAGTLAHKIVVSRRDRRTTARFWPALFEQLFHGWPLAMFVGTTTLISTLLIWPGIVEFAQTGHVSLHWSRVIVAAFGYLTTFMSCVTAVLLQVLEVDKAEAQQSASLTEQQRIAEVHFEESLLAVTK